MHRLLVIGVAALAALTLCGPGWAWTWPADGEVLRPFGMGTDPYAGGQHRGIDIAGADGSTILAPTGGTVTFAGSLPTHGRGLTIQTEDGYAVTLVHLGTLGVAKGALLAEGDLVGTMGSSGTPEHPVPSVHLGIRRSSDAEGYVDPLGLLPTRAAPTPTASPDPTPAPAPSASSASPSVATPAPPPPAAPPPSPAAPPPAVPSPSPPVASSVPPSTSVPAVPSATSSPTPHVAPPGSAAAEPAAASASAPVTAGSAAGTAAAGAGVAPGPETVQRSPRFAGGRAASHSAPTPGSGDARPDGRRVRAGAVVLPGPASGISRPRLPRAHAVAEPLEESRPPEVTASHAQAALPRPTRVDGRPTSSAVATSGAPVAPLVAPGRPSATVSPATSPARDLVQPVRDSGVPLGPIAAAFVLGCIVAMAGIRRAARGIDVDRALLPHSVPRWSISRTWVRSSRRIPSISRLF